MMANLINAYLMKECMNEMSFKTDPCAKVESYGHFKRDQILWQVASLITLSFLGALNFS